MMTHGDSATSNPRPPVSVVVPFRGGLDDGRQTVAALGALRLVGGDELILVDNTPAAALRDLHPDRSVEVLHATDEFSSYYARNVGAERARNDWILFIDADCRPTQTLLDDFFSVPVAEEVGALAGEIAPADQDGLLPRWAQTRRILDQHVSIDGAGGPAAATANLLVRRSAWRAVGGFLEGVRSGADFDFCWRLGADGWRVEFRPNAIVRHVHRETLRAVLRQMARYAAGNAWQNRRSPGSAAAPPGAGALLRAAAGVAGYTVTGRFERAALKAVDGIAVVAQNAGRLLGNAAHRPGPGERGPGHALVVATDRFPVLSETFVNSELRALTRLGWRVRVEAVARPTRPLMGAMRGLTVNFLEDEGTLDRLRAAAWLTCRHPAGCLADVMSRALWSGDERLPLWAIAPMSRRMARGDEDHVHVHFAALAAVNAIRAGAKVRIPVSVAPHGHEVFVTPRSLPEKLARAAFVAAPCDYLASHLRNLMERERRDRVQTVAMGVDGDGFRRGDPYPGGRTVVAVGRLVEKKGFGFLVEATSLLESNAPLDRVVIAGDGPLRSALAQRAEQLGVSSRIELPGALSPQEVRALLEEADLFAMPCVVASNGDRDAMPVVAKEALAMELPVVASDEVGLPELVMDGWGRLVPPGDPQALAGAIESILALPSEERAEMGRAGRRFVLERFSVIGEAEKLGTLIERASDLR